MNNLDNNSSQNDEIIVKAYELKLLVSRLSLDQIHKLPIDDRQKALMIEIKSQLNEEALGKDRPIYEEAKKRMEMR